MSLAEKIGELARACFTGIWIQSHEHDDAISELTQLCQEQQWTIATWNIDQGLKLQGQPASQEIQNSSDPLVAIRAINSLATAGGTTLLVLQNFHRFLNSAETVQALMTQILVGKQNRTILVIVSPIVQLAPELEKLFVVLEHDLPGRDQLLEIAQGIATEQGELPEGAELNAVLTAAAGLTRYEAEGAFSLSLVRHGRVEPNSIWQIKAQQLKKSGLITLHNGAERFNDLGGLNSLKAFCTRAMRRQQHPDPLRRPRGVLLLGVSGSGKSAIAKALGNEAGRPTLLLDVGRLLRSLVGQSEQNIRQALQLVDAMAPNVVMIDEVEKALSGVANSGQTDSGVSARLFGTFLTWLNDHESDSFVVCTANNVRALPPEFSRAERFDGVFFLDLPSAESRSAIWDIYLKLFDLDPQQQRPKEEGWTGAEIRACCRLAALLDVPLTAAAQNVVPVSATAAESVEELRRWANGRCLDANAAGVFQYQGSGSRQRRKIVPDPSSN
jgi:hypothetical protein